MSASNFQLFTSDLSVRRGLIIFFVVHIGLVSYSAVCHSPTQDEVAHLPAGMTIWKFGDFSVYRVNPPLVRFVAAIPVLFVEHKEDWRSYKEVSAIRQEWALGRNFIIANGENSVRLFTLARLVCLPFSLLGMWVCYRWSRDLLSPQAGLIAAGLWCFSPNIIGHGSLITPDVAAVSMGLLAAWRFSLWIEHSTPRTLFLAGISLGLALLTKSYWITLLVLWPTMWLFYFLKNRQNRSLRKEAIQLFGILLLGLNVLNMGYLYSGTGTLLKDFPFYSSALSGELRIPGENLPDNRFKESWLGGIPVPLPKDFVTGIDLQKVDFEQGKWSYFCGEVKDPGGWWNYYLVGLFLKVPLGTWGLFLLGSLALRDRELRGSAIKFLPLILPAILLLIIASLETRMNRHVRYVFPLLPAIYLIGALAIERWDRLSLALLTCTAMSSLAVYPHNLSYFNESIGGPNQGHRYLIDSNLDWGQDLLSVRDWFQQHPENRPVFVGWGGDISLRSLGIGADLVSSRSLKPGWYLISRSEKYHPNERLRIFQTLQPVGQIGYTFDVYRIEEEIHNLNDEKLRNRLTDGYEKTFKH